MDNRGDGEKELASYLKDKQLVVVLEHLKSGDVAFGEVGIERKTVSDLVASVGKCFKYHFWEQLKVLKNTYKYPFVLIEGEIDYQDKLVAGIVFSILYSWKVPIIPTRDLEDSANAIRALFFKYGQGKSNRPLPAAVIKGKTPAQVKWAMLQCVPGIGPRTAAVIMHKVDPFLGSNVSLVGIKIPSNSRAMLKAVFKLSN